MDPSLKHRCGCIIYLIQRNFLPFLTIFILSASFAQAALIDDYNIYPSRHVQIPKPIVKRTYVTSSGSTNFVQTGSWDDWRPDTSCSRSCGGGVASEARHCLDPNLSACTGPSKKYYSCNIEKCPESTPDFRSEQCSAFDSVLFEGRYYEWIPYTKAAIKCELNCMPKGERFYFRHKRFASDGTECDEGHICVAGECLPIGCDNRLGSIAREDKCRKCGGNGEDCNTLEGTFSDNNLQVGYNDIFLIPAGATNILIREVTQSNNYLALRNSTGHYYLNGNWRIDFPRELVFAGTEWHYERKAPAFYAPEAIKALGPISEPIYVVILYQEPNPGIYYEYSIPEGVVLSESGEYAWEIGPWSDCNQQCGGGYRTRRIHCRKSNTGTPMADDLCDSRRKPSGSENCGSEPCSVSWQTSQWSQCDARCGTSGAQYRSVYCSQIIGGVPAVLDDAKCEGEMPQRARACQGPSVCPDWFIGEWGSCSVLCGSGVLSREVVCFLNTSGVITVHPDYQCSQTKPNDTQPCELFPCEGLDWIVSNWTGCAGCASREESRTLYCGTAKGVIYDDSLCHDYRKPIDRRECNTTEQCQFGWYAREWSECTTTCGSGHRTREVFCGEVSDAGVKKVNESNCVLTKKYNDTEDCVGEKEECGGAWFTGPWSQCSKSCGPGQKTRALLCLVGNETSSVSNCNADDTPESYDSCEGDACGSGADELLPVDDSSGVATDECDYNDEMEGSASGGLDGIESGSGDIISELSGDSGIGDFGSGDPLISNGESLIKPKDKASAGVVSAKSDGIVTGSEKKVRRKKRQTEDGEGEDYEYPDIIPNVETPERASAEASSSEIGSGLFFYSGSGEGSSSGSGSGIFSGSGEGSTSGSGSGLVFSGSGEGSTSGSGSGDEMISGSGSGQQLSAGSGVTPKASKPKQMSGSGSGKSEEKDENLPESGSGSGETRSDNTSSGSGESSASGSGSGSGDVLMPSGEMPSGSGSAEAPSGSGSGEIPSGSGSGELTSGSGSGEAPSGSGSGEIPSGSGSGEIPSGSGSGEMPSGSGSGETPSGSGSGEIPSGSGSGEIPSGSGSGEIPSGSGSGEIPSGSGSGEIPSGSGSGEIPSGSGSGEIPSGSGSGEIPSGSGSGEIPSGSGSGEIPSGSGSGEIPSGSGSGEIPSGSGSGEIPSGSGSGETLSGSGSGELPSGSGSGELPSGSGSGEIPSGSGSGEIPSGSGSGEMPSGSGSGEMPSGSGSGETLSGSGSGEMPSGSGSGELPSGSGSGEMPSGSGSGEIPSGSGSGEIPSGSGSSSGEIPSGSGSGSGEMPSGSGSGEIPSGSGSGSGSGEMPSGAGSGEMPSGSGSGEIPSGSGSGEMPSGSGSGEMPSGSGSGEMPSGSGSGEMPSGSGSGSGEMPSGSGSGEIPSGSGSGDMPSGSGSGEMPSGSGEIPSGSGDTISGSGASGDESGSGFILDMGSGSASGDMSGSGESGSGSGILDMLLTSGEGSSLAPVLPSMAATLESRAKCKPKTVNCTSEPYGCCPNGKDLAKGPFGAGCKTPKTCEETKFGCCTDGVTPAIGKNKKCKRVTCSKTLYGCCPNKKTARIGNTDDGCDKVEEIEDTTSSSSSAAPDKESGALCDSTKFKCCDDGITAAHGPNKEGCCLSSEHGCCEDNITPKQGTNGEGCSCMESPWKCCPDNVTASTPTGCGCKFSKDGCCEDGYTNATGPDYAGCPCFTFRTGCCDDGITVAKGSNKEGCGCEFTTEGCCPDGKTPTGNDTCGCESSEFGCCPDGSSEAKGENFRGCGVDIVNPGEVCGLDRVRGSCRNFTVKWFFDMEYGGCSRFWWGGCEGNGNRFNSQDECKSTCVEPEGRDVCLLPRVPGPCEGYFPSYFYDSQREICAPFIYGGCLGNNNRFPTRAECENRCLVDDRIDPCDTPLTPGPCKGNYTRFAYEKDSGKCKEFTYGGCKASPNNFLTESECTHRCSSDGRTRESCYESRSEGECPDNTNVKQAMWYYDSNESRCLPFYYSGCGGTKNRFSSRDDCEVTCPSALLGDRTCSLSPAPGDCTSYTERFYYDRYSSACRPFVYSGCGANDNNFYSLEECRERCDRNVKQEEFDRTTCLLNRDPGPCNDQSMNSWYYDTSDGLCREFTYFGCGGNGNRFATRNECDLKCRDVQDPCSLPVLTGSCSGDFKQYYYHQQYDSCYEFRYTGCQGNRNRFDTLSLCEERCRRTRSETTTTTAPEPEPQRPEPEPRRPEPEPQRPEPEPQRPEPEPQRPEPEPEPQRPEPQPQRPEPEPEPQRPDDNADHCNLPPETGPCRAAYPSYYYNPENSKCEQFIYGGCAGNRNRFNSVEECEQRCGEYKGKDICQDPSDIGPCRGRIEKYYYSQSDLTCNVMFYSGCGGNGNRFSTKLDCDRTCGSGIPQEEDIDRDREEPRYTTTTESEIVSEEPESTCDLTGCHTIQCPYGVQTELVNDCHVCSCYNPCRSVRCGPGTRCAIELNDQQQPIGYCVNIDSPRPPVTPSAFPPQILSPDHGTQVVVPEGTLAEFDCLARGSPEPKITWEKDGYQISTNRSRYHRIDTKLQLVGAYMNDAGDYTCVAANEYGLDRRELELVVEESVPTAASLIPAPKLPPAILGLPYTIRCFALGFPRPQVTWFRGDRLLPFSSEKYAQLKDYTLRLKIVNLKDLGPYTCQAYNGYGRGDSFTIIVEAKRRAGIVFQNGDEEFEKYLVEDSQEDDYTDERYHTTESVTEQEVVTETTTEEIVTTEDVTTEEITTEEVTTEDVTTETPTETTTVSDEENFIVPLRTRIVMPITQFTVGSSFSIICETDGYPPPTITWYKDRVEVDNHRSSDETMFTVNHAQLEDAGNYVCVARNDYGTGQSYVDITIQGPTLHPNCTDNPYFANCDLIVKASYCTNNYYARFCCKTCTLAGQLPIYGRHLSDNRADFRRVANEV